MCCLRIYGYNRGSVGVSHRCGETEYLRDGICADFVSRNIQLVDICSAFNMV